MQPIIRTEGVCRDFPSGRDVVHALKNINLSIMPGTLTILKGRSGSGKTTENVEFGLRIAGYDPKKRKERAEECLAFVGLHKRMHHRPHELSGGEQQRVAIAIALANQPKLLLADEPTGAVDTKTASQIMDVFRELNRSLGVTIIIVTHDRQLSRKVDRVVAIRDGRTSSEFIRRKSYAEELKELAQREEEKEQEEDTHEELIVLDRAGRLQIPREYLEKIGIRGSSKVKMELEGDRIVLFNPNEKENRAKAKSATGDR